MHTLKAEAVSRPDLKRLARTFRRKLGIENELYLDILSIVENVLPRIYGEEYQFIVVEKEEMGEDHGLTTPEAMTIQIRSDVYEGAKKGQGRDRLTVAHELGHFLLHNGLQLKLARRRSEEKIPAYCDVEWQATAFAGELLMADYLIGGLSVQEVVKKCGVSYDAASYQVSKNK